MRLSPVGIALLLSACGAATSQVGLPSDGGSYTTDNFVQARVLSTTGVPLFSYLEYDGGTLRGSSPVALGLAPDFPTQVRVSPGAPYLTNVCARDGETTARWSGVMGTSGIGASVRLLDDGALQVDVSGEGKVDVQLHGAVSYRSCTGDISILPLQQQLKLEVVKVAGFEVSHWYSCPWDQRVFPEGVRLTVPWVRALDPGGGVHHLLNAPRPAELRLKAGRPFEVSPDGFTFAAGPVSVELDTVLPVRGPLSWQIVSRDSVSVADGGLVVAHWRGRSEHREAAGAGSVHRLDHLAGGLVDFDYRGATTVAGPLCTNLPSAWLRATSQTPQVCVSRGAPQVAAPPDASREVPVASLLGWGECRLTIDVPGAASVSQVSFTVEASR